ncbi:MAG: hypothetical protein MN733_14900 [Nitrososphaera sp.]|nr:hypothetical protein [Nitrososphaera sp.]
MNIQTTTEQFGTREGVNNPYFVICGSCYWCASVLYYGFEACPSCKNKNIDSMPISPDETYFIDHSTERGITLDFIPKKKKYNPPS